MDIYNYVIKIQSSLTLNDLIILALFLLINIISFFVMFADKSRATRGARRVSEKALFLWALFFGAFGIYAGMFTWRHKTQKWYFLFGIPVIMLLNIAVLVAIASF